MKMNIPSVENQKYLTASPRTVKNLAAEVLSPPSLLRVQYNKKRNEKDKSERKPYQHIKYQKTKTYLLVSVLQITGCPIYLYTTKMCVSRRVNQRRAFTSEMHGGTRLLFSTSGAAHNSQTWSPNRSTGSHDASQGFRLFGGVTPTLQPRVKPRHPTDP